MRQTRDDLCPLDGRYRDAVAPIRYVCSERALVRYRIEVECRYLIALVKQLNLLPPGGLKVLEDKVRCLWTIEIDEMIDRVFVIERRTLHDVKAVELAIAGALSDKNWNNGGTLKIDPIPRSVVVGFDTRFLSDRYAHRRRE